MSAATIQTDAIGIILAAGDGSRMRSRIPKPLHLAAGKELIRYPVELLAQCGVARIVVVASPVEPRLPRRRPGRRRELRHPACG